MIRLFHGVLELINIKHYNWLFVRFKFIDDNQSWVSKSRNKCIFEGVRCCGG